MKHRLLNMMIALAAISGSATGKTLSVAPIAAPVGEQTEIVIHADDLGADVTALQFNLSLPEGIALNKDAITKGTAASGHELSVSTLYSGDGLFVFYHMNLDAIQDGELLRLPVTIGNDATSGNAQLRKVRFATMDAVSIATADTDALVTDIRHVQTDGRAKSDNARETTYTLDGRRTTAKPAQSGIYIHGSKKVAVK